MYIKAQKFRIALVSYRKSYGAGQEDFWLVKTDSASPKSTPSWTPIIAILSLIIIMIRKRIKYPKRG